MDGCTGREIDLLLRDSVQWWMFDWKDGHLIPEKKLTVSETSDDTVSNNNTFLKEGCDKKKRYKKHFKA